MDLNGKIPYPSEMLDMAKAEAHGGIVVGQSVFFSQEDLARYSSSDPAVMAQIKRQQSVCKGCGDPGVD